MPEWQQALLANLSFESTEVARICLNEYVTHCLSQVPYFAKCLDTMLMPEEIALIDQRLPSSDYGHILFRISFDGRVELKVNYTEVEMMIGNVLVSESPSTCLWHLETLHAVDMACAIRRCFAIVWSEFNITQLLKLGEIAPRCVVDDVIADGKRLGRVLTRQEIDMKVFRWEMLRALAKEHHLASDYQALFGMAAGHFNFSANQ